MIEIDGAMGEGGGQILRTALSLSLVTQRPVRLVNIRAKRSTPGLRPQHCTAVEAAATVGQADVSDVGPGTQELIFRPNGVMPGTYHFDVGTAGSVVLVLQTVLPPLLTAPEPSSITVGGGTHVRWAPPFEFFDRTFRPLVERMGPTLRATIDQYGFYPQGGGRCTVEVQPVSALSPLSLSERGTFVRCTATALVANLPRHIAERELRTLRTHVPVRIDEERIESPPAIGAGNALFVTLAFDHLTMVISGVGQKGVPAETVAERVADEVQSYLEASAPVGPHLADQVLVPLALGGGEGRATTLTGHAHTNAAVIDRFLPGRLTFEAEPTGAQIRAVLPDAQSES